jgi:hypothetical protein
VLGAAGGVPGCQLCQGRDVELRRCRGGGARVGGWALSVVGVGWEVENWSGMGVGVGFTKGF